MPARWPSGSAGTGAGDQETEVFERAAYAAVFQNDGDTPEICLDSDPLTSRQRARLAVRIEDIQDKKRAIALVVHGLPRPEAARSLADGLLPAELATPLLGMAPDTLHAHFEEFWRLLDPPSPISSPIAGDTPMTTSGQPPAIHITGSNPNVAISTGDHSAAQAGKGQTAHVAHTEGADLAVLGSLLQELAGAIGELSSPKARDTLAAHVRVAEAEAGKKDKSDPGLIKRAIDSIKPAAEVLEGGEKIVSLCNKVYQVLAPFL